MTISTAKRKVFVVGLVGGIASGKSQVGKMFESLGGLVIDADKLGHEVLQRPSVANKLSQVFGAKILDGNGQVSRRELGKLVFGEEADSAARRKQLEQIVHPLIHSEALKRLAEARSSPTPPAAVVIDAPLLLEKHWTPMCDVILFIDTPEAVRLERAQQRGWSREHFEARERSQLSLEEKRKAATHIISGMLNEETMRSTIAKLLREMS